MLFVLSCTHAAPNGSQPAVHLIVHGDRELEVDAAIREVAPFAEALSRQDMVLHTVWMVPGEPGMRLAVVERPPLDTTYGPQLIAIDVRGDLRVLHESPRLLDDDFVHPTFFTFADRTFLLADHGSEDAYGMLAWSIEDGRIRDLGELEVALPEVENQSVFTGGAAPTARVDRKDGKYRITIRGPLLLYPRGKDERLIAKQGEVVTFVERDGRFELEPRRGE